MKAIPVVNYLLDVTANSITSLNTELGGDDDLAGFPLVPTKWALQVMGVNAAGSALVAPTSWEVDLLGGLTPLTPPDTSLILAHISGTNANADTVWSKPSSQAILLPARFAWLRVKNLTLNTAAKLRIAVLGMQ